MAFDTLFPRAFFIKTQKRGQILILSVFFFFFGCAAHYVGISDPRLGIEPVSPGVEVLTPGPPGKSLTSSHCF